MGTEDDAGYIRIPTKLFVSSIGSVALVSAGFTAPSDQHQISSNSRPLKTICQKFELNSARSTKTTRSSKESARAGGEAIVTFSQRIADNRQLILDNTTLRWTSAQQDKYQRDQSARDESQERRIMLLERDVDKLGGRQ